LRRQAIAKIRKKEESRHPRAPTPEPTSAVDAALVSRLIWENKLAERTQNRPTGSPFGSEYEWAGRLYTADQLEEFANLLHKPEIQAGMVFNLPPSPGLDLVRKIGTSMLATIKLATMRPAAF